jgi:hypothetical protein
MSKNLEKIGIQLKDKYSQYLENYLYICPDDRQFIEIGNSVKYISIYDKKEEIKTGIVVDKNINSLLLKSFNGKNKWTISYSKFHIFCKFKQNDLIDAINDLLNKQEKNEK